MAGVTVTVNGETDVDRLERPLHRGGLRAQELPRCGTGYDKEPDLRDRPPRKESGRPTTYGGTFAANTPTRVDDITIRDAAEITTISGTVTQDRHLAAEVGDVRIQLTAAAPLNAEREDRSTRAKKDDIVTRRAPTASTRCASMRRLDGATVTVTAERDGIVLLARCRTYGLGKWPGGTSPDINFTAFDNGSIQGRVVDDGDDEPISGVIVTATQASGERKNRCRHHRHDGDLHPQRALRSVQRLSHEGRLHHHCLVTVPSTFPTTARRSPTSSVTGGRGQRVPQFADPERRVTLERATWDDPARGICVQERREGLH